MQFSEQPPSKQWAVLKYRGEKFAEVWFKPEGEPLTLRFRIPRKSFLTPGVGPLLTMENLLKAVGVAAEEVESWHHEGASHFSLNRPDPQLGTPLPLPPPDDTHLNLSVSVKQPPEAVAPVESHDPGTSEVSSEPGPPLTKWEEAEARWRSILGLEATIDTLRLATEGLQAELQAAVQRTLTTEEKVNAFNGDVDQWNKAKSRVHFTLPKAKEFTHRASWTMGTPERKSLAELFKEDAEPGIPVPPLEKLSEQLENLLKDRQVLSANGVTVHQECKQVQADLQRTLTTLQSRAAANADRKRRAAKGGKFFKDIRRWTGVD